MFWLEGSRFRISGLGVGYRFKVLRLRLRVLGLDAGIHVGIPDFRGYRLDGLVQDNSSTLVTRGNEGLFLGLLL